MSYDEPEHADNPVAEPPPAEEATDQQPDQQKVGTADPGRRFRETEVSEEEQAEIAEERQERLDHDNRPENSEVDNTQRTFEDGRFVD